MGRVKDAVRSRTFTNSLVTTSGTVINGILGLLFFIFLAKNLGAENFGIVSLSIATITLVSDIADLGINTGLINFINKVLPRDQGTVYRFMKFGLELKLMIWLAILALGWFSLPLVTQVVLLKPALLMPLRISLFGVGGAMLFSFTTNCLQAFQKFFDWSVLNIFTNALRLVMVLAIFFWLLLDVNSALLVYIAMPFLGFLIGIFLLPKKFLLIGHEQSVRGDFFHYNKWVALSIAVAAVSSRLDSYLTARFLTLKDLGVYSVAVQLTSVVPQLTFAVAAVAAPKLAGFDSIVQAKTYLVKLQLMVLGLSTLGLVAIPLSYFLIPFFYGNAYDGSILPFVILYLGQLFFFASIPSHQAIFYYFSRPKVLLIISSGNLILNFTLGWLLVPRTGIIGAALTMLAGNLFLLTAPLLYVINKFKND